MALENMNIFSYLDFRTYLKTFLKSSARGTQAKLAQSMNCQATYLIQILNGKAKMTDEQAYRCARFLKFGTHELEYFMDLVRMDHSSDTNVIKYFEEKLKKKSKEMNLIKNRVEGSTIEASIQTQLQYYSTWQPSLVHLATSCSGLRTAEKISKALNLGETQVQGILEFLFKNNLVTRDSAGQYVHNGKSLHMEKDSPIHAIFQKARRELSLQKLSDSHSESDFRFSSAFTTSKKHQAQFRKELLEVVDKFHKELAGTESEEVSMLVMDFFQLS
jgi:uncharacterized protein (TIGR02147 family)